MIFSNDTLTQVEEAAGHWYSGENSLNAFIGDTLFFCRKEVCGCHAYVAKGMYIFLSLQKNWLKGSD